LQGAQKQKFIMCHDLNLTRSQAVASIADHTASQQTAVISDRTTFREEFYCSKNAICIRTKTTMHHMITLMWL